MNEIMNYECEMPSFDDNISIGISQYGGVVNDPDNGGFNFSYANYDNGTYPEWPASHQGYRAVDINVSEDDEILYAPFKMKCIYHGPYLEGNITSNGAGMTVFESVNTLFCADGVKRKLNIILFHGYDYFEGSVGTVYEKGEPFYYEGIEGMPLVPNPSPHIHMDFLPGSCSELNPLTHRYELDSELFAEKCVMENQPGPGSPNISVMGIDPNISIDFHKIFFGDNVILLHDGYSELLWDNEEYFVLEDAMRSKIDNIPTHGFIKMAGNTYFYDYGTMVKGWLTRLNGEKYYLDPSNYYLRRGWLQLNYPGETETHWFYFNNSNDYNIAGYKEGQMASSKWVASGSSWYFCLRDGKMAYSCQVEDPDTGLFYKFDANGVCENPSTGRSNMFSGIILKS